MTVRLYEYNSTKSYEGLKEILNREKVKIKEYIDGVSHKDSNNSKYQQLCGQYIMILELLDQIAIFDRGNRNA